MAINVVGTTTYGVIHLFMRNIKKRVFFFSSRNNRVRASLFQIHSVFFFSPYQWFEINSFNGDENDISDFTTRAILVRVTRFAVT